MSRRGNIRTKRRSMMNSKRRIDAWLLWLTVFLLASMIVAGCRATPTPAPPTTEAPPAPTKPPTMPPPPTPTEVVKAQIVVAYDTDIDHVEPMQFRSLGAYDATANLYEPLIAQELVANPNGEVMGQRQFEGAGAA